VAIMKFVPKELLRARLLTESDGHGGYLAEYDEVQWDPGENKTVIATWQIKLSAN
jgi:hypothetical protein